MADKKRIKLEWIIIILLFVIILVGAFFIFSNKNNITVKNEQKADSSSISEKIEQPDLMKKYDKLEQAYNNTLHEIETVVSDDDVNISILKENLRQILETIKQNKAIINSKGDTSKVSNTKQLEDMLDMSKEVLAERLIEEKQKNEKLTIDNRKLTVNLKKSVTNFEQEKNNNVKLNDEVEQIKSQIKSLKNDGDVSTNELKSLEKQKFEMEKKLTESNKTIKNQNQQIQDLGEVIRKVTINCYFYYEKGNPDEEAVIYLTSEGISEKYVKYFIRKKPDIYVQFKISKDFFTYNVEKVDLKLYNSLNVEIYSVSKVINAENLKIIIPNKNFSPGKYYVELKAGDEALLLDDKYQFNISN
jgi:hypothetical protein